MSEQTIHMPALIITNPLLLWLFRHGWEEPGWGQSTVDQLTIALAIHDLATKIADEELRKRIQGAAAQGAAKMAEGLVRESF